MFVELETNNLHSMLKKMNRSVQFWGEKVLLICKQMFTSFENSKNDCNLVENTGFLSLFLLSINCYVELSEILFCK